MGPLATVRGPLANTQKKTWEMMANPDVDGQARNQLGTSGGAKSFLRGAQNFWTVSNSFRLCPTHYSRGGEKFSTGGFTPLQPWLRSCGWLNYKILNHRKIIRKTDKNNNVLKTKRMLKPKYKLSGGRYLGLACQGGNSPLCPFSHATGYDILYLHALL